MRLLEGVIHTGDSEGLANPPHTGGGRARPQAGAGLTRKIFIMENLLGWKVSAVKKIVFKGYELRLCCHIFEVGCRPHVVMKRNNNRWLFSYNLR